jgi:hypothetical protein
MKTEVKYVVEGQLKPVLEWAPLVVVNTVEAARNCIDTNKRHNKRHDFAWSYRIVKRTTTVQDEVIE